jgi:hypothetical protein
VRAPLFLDVDCIVNIQEVKAASFAAVQYAFACVVHDSGRIQMAQHWILQLIV